MTQVLRIDRTQRGPALERHLTGDSRPKTARPRDGISPVEFHAPSKAPFENVVGPAVIVDRAESDAGAKEAMKHAAACRRAGKRVRGRKAEPIVQFLIAGLPRLGDEDAWFELAQGKRLKVHEKRNYCRLYHQRALEWLIKCAGPGSRLVRAVSHYDEAAPHMHVQLVAADADDRLGWNRIRGGFATSPVGRGEHARGLSEMQDEFQLHVAKGFYLARGEASVGAGRKHEPIDRDRGLELRLDEERAAREQLQRQVRQLQEQLAALTVERQPRKRRNGPSPSPARCRTRSTAAFAGPRPPRLASRASRRTPDAAAVLRLRPNRYLWMM